MTVRMGKDKKGKSDTKEGQVGREKEKQAKKADKKAKVKAAKVDGSDVEDVDLDAVLEEYKKQQEQFLKVTETVVDGPRGPVPHPHSFASPSNSNQLLLFGGEYFNGALATFFNDLMIYYIDRDEWRSVTSPNAPLPRSGHAWCRGGNQSNSGLLVRRRVQLAEARNILSLQRLLEAGSQLEGMVTPGAQGQVAAGPKRAPHDLLQELHHPVRRVPGYGQSDQVPGRPLGSVTRRTLSGYNPALPPAQLKPDARSSFTLLPHEQGAVLFGGYSRVKTTVAANKQARGGSQGAAQRPEAHGPPGLLLPAHHPASRRRTAEHASGGPVGKAQEAGQLAGAGAGGRHHGIPQGAWYHVRRRPRRGGERGGHGQRVLQCHVRMERRAKPLLPAGPAEAAGPDEIRRRRAAGRSAGTGAGERRGAAPTAGGPPAGRSLDDLDEMELDRQTSNAAAEEEDGKPTRDMPVSMEFPHLRFNAQLAVQDDVLYIYGGTFEKGDREFTFDDLYAIDLGKMDGCRRSSTARLRTGLYVASVCAGLSAGGRFFLGGLMLTCIYRCLTTKTTKTTTKTKRTKRKKKMKTATLKCQMRHPRS